MVARLGHGDLLAPKPGADEHGGVVPADAAYAADAPDEHPRRVLPFHDHVLVDPRTLPVDVRRHLAAQSEMRALVVVEAAEHLGLRDDVQKVGHRPQPFKALALPRLVEALLLPLRLRVQGASVDHEHAKLHRPHLERRDAVPLRCAPRIAVVAQDGLRQPVFAERMDERRLHGLERLVQQGSRHDCVAAAIVDHVQGMAPLSGREFEVPLEVGLPHLVGFRLREPPQMRGLSHGALVEKVVPTEDVRHGGPGGNARKPPAPQHERYLLASKRRMVGSQRQYLGHHVRRRRPGRVSGSAAPVAQ